VPSIHNPNLPLKHPQKQKTQPKLELKPLKNPPKPHSHQTPRASLFDDDISNRVTTLIGETLSIQDSMLVSFLSVSIASTGEQAQTAAINGVHKYFILFSRDRDLTTVLGLSPFEGAGPYKTTKKYC
jgi:hypothetical protein